MQGIRVHEDAFRLFEGGFKHFDAGGDSACFDGHEGHAGQVTNGSGILKRF